MLFGRIKIAQQAAHRAFHLTFRRQRAFLNQPRRVFAQEFHSRYTRDFIFVGTHDIPKTKTTVFQDAVENFRALISFLRKKVWPWCYFLHRAPSTSPRHPQIKTQTLRSLPQASFPQARLNLPSSELMKDNPSRSALYPEATPNNRSPATCSSLLRSAASWPR